MSGAPHGGQRRHSPWVAFAVIFFVVTFVVLLWASVTFGGAIISGFCFWLAGVVATLFAYMLSSGHGGSNQH